MTSRPGVTPAVSDEDSNSDEDSDEAELRAVLDVELPAHLRAFAAAHAAGAMAPAAPAALLDAVVIARALAGDSVLARLCVPLAIESSPDVIAARRSTATTAWNGYHRLVAARDAAAQRVLGYGHTEVLHALMGATAAEAWHADPGFDPRDPWPPRLDAWHAAQADGAAPIADVWRALGGPAGLQILASATAHPRAFLVRPRAEVIVVAQARPRSPCDRFEALHELGHAIAALICDPLPRVIDEAVAAYVARHQEVEGVVPPGWASPVAAAARTRRIAIARRLDAIERARPLPMPPAELPNPPWALVHDPAAQAVYVAAQPIADRWWAELGPLASLDHLAAAIAIERARIDAG